MKLHYSQTTVMRSALRAGFTTLWNYTTLKQCQVLCLRDSVLLPYEITLLSNNVKYYAYEIEFYYLMKLHYSQTSALFLNLSLSFTTLWNYTTLKRVVILRVRRYRFTTLWNYTTLKLYDIVHDFRHVLLPYEITLLSNLKWE